MTDDEQVQSRREAILAEYAEEEAEAAEIEVAENDAALNVPLNLRITKGLDAQLRQRAAAEQIPTSALVRRLLASAVQVVATAPVLRWSRSKPLRGASPQNLSSQDLDQVARRAGRSSHSSSRVPAGSRT